MVSLFSRHRSLRAVTAAAAIALTATMVTPLTASANKPGSCGRASGCTPYELIHAGSTYKWWPEAKRFEFKSSGGVKVPQPWKLTGKPEMWASGAKAYGTLGVKTGSNAGDVYSDWRYAKKNGRWEVRYRTLSHRDAGSPTIRIVGPDGKRVDVRGTDYKSRLELVPAGTPAQRCTPTSILMAGFDPAERAVATVGLTAPGAAYSGKVKAWSQLGDLNAKRKWKGPSNTKVQAWHVYAVELTKTKVTWFLDGKVIRQAPRPASIMNTKFSFRAGLLGSTDPEVQTAHTTSQMDWARYWTLKRTTKKKKKLKAIANAPKLARTTATKIGPC